MLVQDIIRRAAFNSGVISSFNPNDVPRDIMDAGFELLSNEILPSMNCDRMLDVTEISKNYVPKDGCIDIVNLPMGWEGVVIGDSDGIDSSKWVDNASHPGAIPAMLESVFGITHANAPRDQTGHTMNMGIWCRDGLFVELKCTETPIAWDSFTAAVVKVDGFPVNTKFPVMRVRAVFEADTRAPFKYLYVEEFESSEYKGSTYVYCVEEYENRLRVRLKEPRSSKKLLILPVPLVITSTDENLWGQIKCPPKFNQYLVDALAVRLATVYGLSTVSAMESRASTSLAALKKNVTQPRHPTNVNREIGRVLKSNRAQSWRFDGFV